LRSGAVLLQSICGHLLVGKVNRSRGGQTSIPLLDFTFYLLTGSLVASFSHPLKLMGYVKKARK
jgi:hypothetical protein